MIITNVMNNLNTLTGRVRTPFRFDYQYDNSVNLDEGEVGTISTFFNQTDGIWKIMIVITNSKGDQSAKQLVFFRRSDEELIFNGFWESISYWDVKKIICQAPSWKMNNFWEDYVDRLTQLTENMIREITENEFDNSVREALNQQTKRHRQRGGDKNEESIFPWYLRNSNTIKPNQRKKISSRYGYPVLEWLLSNNLTLVFTSDIKNSKTIYINDLEKIIN
ncbi:hypothetical protein MKX57_10990 [Lysinibacillus sp. FSL M8-0216]|uniref:hypothetical protein n=1 Tax=Lysinibacillus TaxID=400634 RepID=UPI00315A30B3